jgi:hypothetical protein
MTPKSYHGRTGVLQLARTRASTHADLAQKKNAGGPKWVQAAGRCFAHCRLVQKNLRRTFDYSFIVTVLTSV